MGKPTGFIDYKREEAKERDHLTRINDWGEYQGRLTDEQLKTEGARCMNCSIPFCHTGIDINNQVSGCPLNNLIPEWNDLVYKERFEEALDRLLMTNNFPEFTGRVCPAPCEGACTASIHDDAVGIKSIERAIIDRGFEEGYIKARIPRQRTGKKVAIIGSGPSGLSAADELNQQGHTVTIFEKANRPGGLLMYGIPTMKLDKDIVARRIDLLKEEGIKFKLNTEVGQDVLPEDLKRDFDSIIVCTGAESPRDLNIQGRQLKGIHFAMDYLTEQTQSYLDGSDATLTAKGKNVVVIGGGDTGADCVATAIRQGAKNVRQLAITPAFPKARATGNDWPSYPNVFREDYAHKEAKIIFNREIREFLTETHAFIDNGEGHVQALFTRKIEEISTKEGVLYEKVHRGDDVIPADLVILAIGFVGPTTSLLERFGVTVQNNRIQADYKDFRTNVKDVFAAGDARRGPSLIVWAIQEGREVAKAVHHYLQTKKETQYA